MPTTDSFTSTAAVVSSTTVTFTDNVMMSDGTPGSLTGPHVEYSPRGFRVATAGNRVQITKATAFGGSQVALSFPLKLEDARDLAVVLKRVAT
jgi:hypothetical protein